MPFFKEKEVIKENSKDVTSSIIKDRMDNTFYHIIKIVGTEMYCDVYVFKEPVIINQKYKVADFDITTKYLLVTNFYPLPITVVLDAMAKKWSITDKIYMSKEEAKADLKHDNFIFQPRILKNGNLLLEDETLINKSK